MIYFLSLYKYSLLYRDTDIENKYVDTKGERWRGVGRIGTDTCTLLILCIKQTNNEHRELYLRHCGDSKEVPAEGIYVYV